MQKTVELILEGGVVIYPTETLYALGCDATNQQAVRRIAKIKRRPLHKPLPLIIGSMEMLEQVTADCFSALGSLCQKFWPGSLSILVRARETLAPEVSDSTGFVSVRFTPHPLATKLCRKVGKPLVATSANFCGKKAVAKPKLLDPKLISLVDETFLDIPHPSGKPSTLVRLLEKNTIEILRSGAVSEKELQAKGFVRL